MLRGHDAALDELPHRDAQAPVHQHFGGDEQRQAEQEAHVHVDVEEERHLHAAPRRAARQRERDERQPGERDEHHDAPPGELGGRLEQPAAQVHLVERAAQDQREVLRAAGPRHRHALPA